MMNQREIFRKAGDILKELQEQYTFLAKDPDNLNELELELFMANSSFLSDHIHILNKLNDKKHGARSPQQVAEPAPEELETLSASDHPEEAETTDTGDTHHEMPAEEVTKYFLLNEEEQIRLEEAHKDVPQIIAEESTETKASAEEEEQGSDTEETEGPEAEQEDEGTEENDDNESIEDEPEEEVEEAEEEKNLESEPETEKEEEAWEPEKENTEETKEEIAEPEQKEVAAETKSAPGNTVQEITQTERTIAVPVEQVQVNPEPAAEKRTLNEIFSAQKAASQGIESRPAPQYTDLKSMISLNDKLLFVKDLFNGYSLAYSEAIDIANKQSGFEAANQFLQSNYAQKNNWADKQQTVDKLYEILNRRFPG